MRWAFLLSFSLNVNDQIYNFFITLLQYRFISTQMGNKNNKTNDQFLKAVDKLKKRKNDHPVEKVATHLEQRYKNLIIEALNKQQMNRAIKNLLMDCIEYKVKKQDLTSALTVLNSLRSNNAENLLKSTGSTMKLLGESKNVLIKFDKKTFKYQRVSNQPNQVIFREEDSLEGRVKHTGNFICKQLHKQYHPFRVLCKRYSDILVAFLENEDSCSTDKQYDDKQEMQRKSLKQFCQFLANGCLKIYKKWIMEYTGMQEKKYEKWVFSLIINQIWAVNEGYMLNSISKIISKSRVPLKIDVEGIKAYSSMGLLQPKDFAIDEQLRIEGHYFSAIFQMSGLCERKKPLMMLKQLQNIKNSICIDIDNYHKLCEKGQIYEVNGDNILGIVAYVLTKVPTKIEQISVYLLFLKLVYGEGIFYNMDSSSYMYSTIWGAIQYLEGKTFQQIKCENYQEKSVSNETRNESFSKSINTNS